MLSVDPRVHFDTWLDEWEETWPESRLHFGTFEKLAVETLDGALEMCKRHIASHGQAFELVKFCFVRHVGCLVAENFARRDHAVRRLDAFFDLRFHVPNLHIRRLCAQPHFFFPF